MKSTGFPQPPQPVIIRWGTWVCAVGYYAKHFNSVKEFTLTLSDDSQAIIRAKKLFESETLVATLAAVASNSGNLPAAIEKLQNGTLSLAEEIAVVEEFKSTLPQAVYH